MIPRFTIDLSFWLPTKDVIFTISVGTYNDILPTWDFHRNSSGRFAWLDVGALFFKFTIQT